MPSADASLNGCIVKGCVLRMTVCEGICHNKEPTGWFKYLSMCNLIVIVSFFLIYVALKLS